MAGYTEHYNLLKPAEEDYYDIGDFNENMDTIDGQMAETEAQINGMGDTLAEMNGKIGTAAAGEEPTLFGQLRQMAGAATPFFKSIQHVTYSLPKGCSSGTRSIERVEPRKCFVLFERLGDATTGGCAQVSYGLFEDHVSFYHGNYSSTPYVEVGCWVVEVW